MSEQREWFARLVENPYIELVIVADNQGHILRSTRPLRSDHEYAASMIQSMEVLAQVLASALGCGEARMVQLSTRRDHIFLFPLARSTHFLVVATNRNAPLALVMVELERVIAGVTDEHLSQLRDASVLADDTPVLDAVELIQAVQEWLHNRPAGE
jgi:predicted regulator of Ras-like GTPase activity (Roadblock/LC7/MglB family)